MEQAALAVDRSTVVRSASFLRHHPRRRATIADHVPSVMRLPAAPVCEKLGAAHNGATCMGPITIAEFYRAEAARCRDRAEKASTPERATRWRLVAEDCLRVATELEAADDQLIRQRHHHQSGIKLSFPPQGLSQVGEGGKALGLPKLSYTWAQHEIEEVRVECGFELLAKCTISPVHHSRVSRVSTRHMRRNSVQLRPLRTRDAERPT